MGTIIHYFYFISNFILGILIIRDDYLNLRLLRLGIRGLQMRFIWIAGVVADLNIDGRLLHWLLSLLLRQTAPHSNKINNFFHS
jgi:hypothetical protein